MTKKRSNLATVIAIAVFSVVSIVGCSSSSNVGGASPSAGAAAQSSANTTPDAIEVEYFDKLAVIFNDGEQRSNAASDTLNSELNAAKSLDGQKAAINTFLDTMIGVFRDAADRMDNLSPPSDAKDGHQRFRDDVSQAKDISAGLQTDILAAQSADAATTIINDFNTRVNALVSDSQQACSALQHVADGQAISVNLKCTAST